MTGTMKAYQVVDLGSPPRMMDIPVPQPYRGEVLVRLAGNGLCHSDFAIMNMPATVVAAQNWTLPFTLGHEAAGWIEDIGPDVTGFEVDDAVLVMASHSDGTCPYCRQGLDNACVENYASRGCGRDGGGLAEYLVTSARLALKLGGIDPAGAGPLSDAGLTSYHAVKRVLPKLVPGTTAVIIGAGGLGSFAVQYLRRLSAARVVAVDINPARLDFARELGAHETILHMDEAARRRIVALDDGLGAAAVIDFVGSESTIEEGLACVRRGGIFVMIGAAFGGSRTPWYNLLPKEAEICALQGGTIAEQQEVIALANAGLIRNEVEFFPFSRVEEAYGKLHEGKLRGRAVVTPNRWL